MYGAAHLRRLRFTSVKFFSISPAFKVPKNIRGVNLGSWLLIEPWMIPEEWQKIGGENSCDCKVCIGSEFNFAKAYPDTVDQRMATHWETWFTQSDVDTLVKAGINSVRIPLGYWLVEDLVDRKTEFYARGGLKHLKRGLRQLKAAGVGVLLDHHALPGVASPNQMFAGKCTTDVQFYTPYNYRRALVWTAVMTALSHLDKDFENVWGIQAINEPIMDATLTPGYGDFQKNFVLVTRAVELGLGIRLKGVQGKQANVKATLGASMKTAASSDEFNEEVSSAISAALPILDNLGFSTDSGAASFKQAKKEPLHTTFMDVSWQYNNPANPADAAIGPQIYDNHLYYSYGGVADANEEAYLKHICNLDRLEASGALGNSPLFFGEWSLATQFEATDEFLFKWADAQKLKYSEGAGWFFWNFKLGKNSGNNRQWSYFDILDKGFFKWNPTAYNDPNVCAPYVVNTTETSS